MDVVGISCTDTSKEVSLSPRAFEIITGADSRQGFGAVLDVALALYPIFIFWSLKLQLHIKIGLMVLFGFGVV